MTTPRRLAAGAPRLLELLRLSPLYGWIYRTASRDSVVSIEKACSVLGFDPRYSNRQALLRIRSGAGAAAGSGVTHREPWKHGILRLVRMFL